MAAVYWKGVALSATLIIAIGAQNAFILKQGLKRTHRFKIAFVSSIGDSLLFALGIGGFGTILSHYQLLSQLMAIAGILFLFFYGSRSFFSAFGKAKHLDLEAGRNPTSAKKIILLSLAFSLLNPHCYIDTVVIMGGIAAQFPLAADRWALWLGSITSSVIWFFGTAYGASFFTPLFKRAIAWRILDFGIGCIMWFIAFGLIRELLHF